MSSKKLKIKNIRNPIEHARGLICSYNLNEYINMVKSFHGYAAPGVLIGGFMVCEAYQKFDNKGLYDVICETSKCLPDAIQLLTPCTIGNGWLKIINLGRYAITFYKKYTGEGVRVFVDPVKIESLIEIKTWFFKLKPKKEQDDAKLLKEICEAGANICSTKPVKIKNSMLVNTHRSGFFICPHCHEAYPADDGEICRGCNGEAPYITDEI
jgi:formylmethanofuran dehydrogenase subunit E